VKPPPLREPEGRSEADDSLGPRLSSLLREMVRAPAGGTAGPGAVALGPGLVVGRFKILREIGRGGFGAVYEAQDLELGRAVAFKLLRPEKAVPSDERFLAEAEAAARLAHPNIVTLFDVGRCEEGPYLVFELLHGMTLAERMRQGRLDVNEALRIGTEVARGLSHAHAHGVVHRDLSPRNVFLGEDDQVKVLDFGMAYAFGHRNPVGGTPGYMAPEQRRGAPEDERTDVFALGVLLYRLLADRSPFPADGEITRPAPALDLPAAPRLGPLISRMLAIDPVDRPRDGREVLATLSTRAPPSAGPPDARRVVVRRSRARAAAAIALAVLAGATTLAWIVWRGRSSPAPQTSPSVAVLPFEAPDAPADHDFFSEGLAEEILSALSQVEGLRVPSRTSSDYFKGKRVRLSEIGRQLRVANVLEGSARRAGRRVRVSVRLVRTADDTTIWSRSFDREISDIFDVQDEIARSVVDALAVNVRADRSESLRAYRSKSADAYTLYLEGNYQFQLLTREGFRRATEAYRRALGIDPVYPPAWAALSIALRNTEPETDDPAAAKARDREALAAAERAVVLAPRMAEAISARAVLRGEVDHDWAGAREDIERALALGNPTATTLRRHALVLLAFGRLPEGLSEARRAAELDPLGVSVYELGLYLQEAGELEESETVLRRHLATTPRSLLTRMELGKTLLLRARPREAAEIFAGIDENNYRLQGLAMAEHALGDGAASDARLQELVTLCERECPFLVAEVHGWRGERTRALAWIAKSVEAEAMDEGDRWSPFLRSLRDAPELKAIVLRLGLPMDTPP